MVKKLIDTATKTEADAAKTASKRVVKETAVATGDLIGNKIAGKFTSLGKTKSDGKVSKTINCSSFVYYCWKSLFLQSILKCAKD